MSECEHKKVVFAGIQERTDNEKPLVLFRCLVCGSTITMKRTRKRKKLAKAT